MSKFVEEEDKWNVQSFSLQEKSLALPTVKLGQIGGGGGIKNNRIPDLKQNGSKKQILLVSVDGHRHATGTTACTGQLAGLESDNKLLILIHIHFATANIISIQHTETSSVKTLYRIHVALISNNLSIAQREEISTAMPLFTVLIPTIRPATEHRLHIHTTCL
jgi:hypothetical protein